MNYFTSICSKKKIGLLGGSFDPPHSGHLNISKVVEKKFGFDKIIWLVNHKNPIKKVRPQPIEKRISLIEKIIKNENIVISDIEAKLDTKFTKDLLKRLFVVNTNVNFVWIMGSDNFCNFHLWKDWSWIMENIPIIVVSRPGTNVKVISSKAAIKYKKYRLDNSKKIIYSNPPSWTLFFGKKNYESSTKIRKILRK